MLPIQVDPVPVPAFPTQQIPTGFAVVVVVVVHTTPVQFVPPPWKTPPANWQALKDMTLHTPPAQQAPGAGVVVVVPVVPVVVVGGGVVGRTVPQRYRLKSQSDSLREVGYCGQGQVVGQGSSILVQLPLAFPLNMQYFSQACVVQHSQPGLGVVEAGGCPG